MDELRHGNPEDESPEALDEVAAPENWAGVADRVAAYAPDPALGSMAAPVEAEAPAEPVSEPASEVDDAEPEQDDAAGTIASGPSEAEQQRRRSFRGSGEPKAPLESFIHRL